MKTGLAMTLLITSIVLTSCETNTQTGALTGAGVGVVAGGLISGSPTGALIGGAIGAAGGALIGYAMDEHDRAVMAERNPQTMHRIDRGEQLSIDDVKNMSNNGLRDDVIINQIKATNSQFTLSADDIIDLKDAGVSQHVINYMIETGE